jgi:hypothetical protein
MYQDELYDHHHKSGLLEVPTESGTFQDSAAAAFNSLPADSLRNCKDFNIFRTIVKIYLTVRDLAHERLGPGYK